MGFQNIGFSAVRQMASTIMESLFQRTLEDLVKGLRVQMIGEARYIASHLEEIRKEIKSTDAHTKTVALQKLTYINMLHGIDMEWAAFHVIEVMSMTKFAHKKIGYLAASQSFHEGIDVLLLITNQLRKDLSSTNEYEAGLALECLSCIATPDLAQELTPEVFALLVSGRLYVRKRATLVILKLFSKYPDAVRIACKRLVEKMEDSDPKVVCAAVSVFCEMAMKDPRSCIPLAPEFYRLLVDSKNNWLTIKVVKIFGVLAPLEPRLGRKIAEPLCELMRKTGAKSLLLECIRTVIAGLPDHTEAMKLAVEKLKELLEEDDPNLKYLGLQALAALMPAHPWAVAENKSIIVRSLNDEDHSIQMASLQLVLGMVSDSNVMETVQVLMQYAERSDVSFCNELIGAILATCSRGLYELVPDFSWYVSVLGEVARIPDSAHGKELERQFVDIGIRVKEVRGDLVTVARGILLDPTLLEHPSLHRVLSAVAWIAGEYVEFSRNPFELIEALLQPRTKLLPPSVQAVYLQSVLKVFVYFSFLYLRNVLEHTEVHTVAGAFSSTDLKGDVSSRQPEPDLYWTLGDTRTKEASPQEREDEDIMSLANEYDRETISTAQGDLQHSNTSFSDDFLPRQYTGLEGESLDRILELIDLNVGPLAESMDVEVQERACNLLGVAKALRGNLVPSGELGKLSKSSQESSTERAFEIIKFLRGVFAQELGPVSVFAQGRVTLPDGLVLEENLDSLDAMFCDEQVAQEKEEWITGEPMAREWEVGTTFVQKIHDDVSKPGESASLLAQHRERHGTYYLPVEKESMKVDGYPPPRIAQSDVPSTSTASENIMKLAEQSLLWTKARRVKPRPVMVRLDDAEEALIPSIKAKKDLKDDVISSAIRDVLVGDKSKHSSRSAGKEGILASTSPHHHRKSHRQGRQHDKNGTQEATMIVHNTVEEEMKKTERKSGKQRHSKHTKVGSITFEGDFREKGRHGELHQSSGQRSRHRVKSPVSLSPQTPVLPDFLL